MTRLQDNDRCYVCGAKNQIGLAIAFEINRDASKIHASFTPAVSHQGFEGIVHGGILSAVLDEAMAKLAFSLDLPAVTAEMTIKFKAPAAPGDVLAIEGSLKEISHKLIFAEATITRGPVVIAEAKGKLLRV
jgi:acyl-coenzyme A thioesterase PaaI-like protein